MLRKQFITATLGLTLAAAVFASGGQAAARHASSATLSLSGVGSSVRWGSTSKTWVKYNRSTCKFQTVSNHPKTYVSVLRKASSPYKIAYTPEDQVVPFLLKQNPSVMSEARKAGVQIKLFDNQYPSTTQPLVVADAVVQYKPAVVLSMNVYADLYPKIMTKYNAACLPTIEFDLTPPPNTIFFGVKQSDLGAVGAKYAVKVIKQRHWPLGQVWAVSCADSDVGSAAGGPYDRVAYFQKELQRELAGIPASNYTLLNCHTKQGSAESQTQVTDWLTAHPQAQYVVSNAVNDIRCLGMYAALKKFGSKAVIIGIDADPANLKLVNGGDPTFVGDVSQFPERRGQFIIPTAIDIAQGKAVPNKLYMPPAVIHK